MSLKGHETSVLNLLSNQANWKMSKNLNHNPPHHNTYILCKQI